MASTGSVVEWRILFNCCRAFRRARMCTLNIAILIMFFCCCLLAFNPKWDEVLRGRPTLCCVSVGCRLYLFAHDALTLLCFALTDFALIDFALIDFALFLLQHFHYLHCCANGHVKLQGRMFAPAFSLPRQRLFIDTFALYDAEVFY